MNPCLSKVLKKQKAFSLIEIVTMVALLGIIVLIGIKAISNLAPATKMTRIQTQVAQLNSAINMYVSSGGSLENIDSAAEVLGRLKTKMTAAQANKFVGFTGNTIDEHFQIVEVTSSSEGPRAIYNSGKKKFEISTEKIAGYHFVINDEGDGGAAPIEETRRSGAVEYASNSSWIWDYQETSKQSLPAATTVTLTNPINTSPSVLEPLLVSLETVNPGPAPADLLPPLFSMPTGAYDISLFDFTVSLINPNQAGISKLMYSVDYGPWLPYTAPLTVQPESVVQAQVTSLTPVNWNHSALRTEYYHVTPETLTPPVILSSAEKFGGIGLADVSVLINDSNNRATSEIQYRINGGIWNQYTSPFTLRDIDYPTGASIEARVSPLEEYYLGSISSEKSIDGSALLITGTGLGKFSNPRGPANMVTNLIGGGESEYFEWGNDVYAGMNLSKSWLSYGGAQISNVVLGDRFQIGTFNYYNGTFLSGTGAVSVDLTVDLAIDINGTAINTGFDFSIDLNNTINQFDPLNLWQDADYVSINNPVANSTIFIGEDEYELRLEFGEASSDGFALFDQFHVLEQKSASVNTYGTLVKVNQSGSSGGSGLIDTSVLENLIRTAELASVSAEAMSVAAEDQLAFALSIYQQYLGNGWTQGDTIAAEDEYALYQAQAKAEIAAEGAAQSQAEAEAAASAALIEAGRLVIQALTSGGGADAWNAVQRAQVATTSAIEARLASISANQASSNVDQILIDMNLL
jgi:type II secretory pathway pseudopilin PulG